MEQIIKNYIINELGITDNYSDAPKKRILTKFTIHQIITIFSISPESLKRYIYEIMKKENYEIVSIGTLDEVRLEFDNISNSNESDFNYLLNFFNVVKELKLHEAKSENYQEASDLRVIEKEIAQLMIDLK